MSWLLLSLGEWRRRTARTSLTAAGVAIAIASLFSLLAFQDGYRAGMESELGRLGAHILVVPKGCPYDAASIALHGASWPCYLKADYLGEVRAVPGVATAAPAFMTAFYSDEGTPRVYVGVDRSILQLKPGWTIQGHFPQNESEVLAGAEVARRNGWRAGQAINLPDGEIGKVRLSGVLAPTHGAEDDFIFLRLPDAQRVFNHGGELTHILVKLIDPNRLDDAIAQLRGCNAGMEMNVVPLAHLFRTIRSLVNTTRLWLGCIAVVALLIAGAGLSNAILMSVAERTREIGIMRAVGAARADIFRLIWLETLQVCLVGSVFGIAVSFAAARAVEAWLRTRLPFAPTDPLMRWQWWIVGLCFVCALAVGSVAGFLPAIRAACLSPVEAMRSRGGRI